MRASRNGHLNVVNRLLECKKIEVNVKDENGCTALIWASLKGHLDMVERLSECEKDQIREGFNLSRSYNSVYLIKDLEEMVIDFTVNTN